MILGLLKMSSFLSSFLRFAQPARFDRGLLCFPWVMTAVGIAVLVATFGVLLAKGQIQRTVTHQPACRIDRTSDNGLGNCWLCRANCLKKHPTTCRFLTPDQCMGKIDL